MRYTACVNVGSGDLPALGPDVARESALAGALPGVRLVQNGEVLERSGSHEAVSHIACVNEVSCNLSEQVDAESNRALVRGCARARSIECGEGAQRTTARNALVAVKHVAIV